MSDKPISLREHLEAVIAAEVRRWNDLRTADNKAVETAMMAAEKAVNAALAASKEAILKAEGANDVRLGGLNELRGLVTDQQRTFANKSETEFRISAVEKKMDEMALANSASGGGRAGTYRATLLMFQVIAALGVVSAIVFGAIAFWGGSQ